MSGNFARGFMETFPKSFAMDQAKRENAFERMYSTFEKNRAALDEYKREDAKAIQAAKAIIQSTPGMPEGALKEVYEKVKAIGYDNTAKWASSVRITPSEVAPGQVNAPTDSTGAQTTAVFGEDTTNPSIANSPTGSGTLPQEQYTQPGGLPSQGPVGGGLLGKVGETLGGLRDRNQKNLYDSTMKRMASETGLPMDQVQQIMEINQGGIPQEVLDASGGQQFQITPADTTVQSPLDYMSGDEANKRRNAVLDKSQEKIINYNKKRGQMRTVTNSIYETSKIIQDDSAVLTDYVSGGASFLSNVQKEVSAFVDVFGSGGERAPGAADALGNKAAQLEQEYAVLASDKVNRVANSKRLVELRTRIDAYTVASMLSQEGRSLAEDERKMFNDMLSPNTTVAGYKQNMYALISRLSEGLDQEGQALMQDGAVADWNTQVDRSEKYGQVPGMKIDVPQTSYLQELEADPTLGPKWKEMQDWQREDGAAPPSNTNMGSTGTPQGGTPQALQQQQPQVPSAPTEESFKAAQSVNPGQNPTMLLKEAERMLNADRTPEAEAEFLELFRYLPPRPQAPAGIPTGG